MKRNKTVECALKMHMWDPPFFVPKTVLAPGTVVRYTKPVEGDEARLSHTFRIGYYSRQEGPNTVWLVDSDGVYRETWDQNSVAEHFEVLERSDEIDTYGINCEKLGRIG